MSEFQLKDGQIFRINKTNWGLRVASRELSEDGEYVWIFYDCDGEFVSEFKVDKPYSICYIGGKIFIRMEENSLQYEFVAENEEALDGL